MTTEKRRVDVVTAGWPLRQDAVRFVTFLACPSCEVRGYNLWEGCAANQGREKAARYGVMAAPAVVVNGVLVACCRRASITADRLIAARIG